MLGWNFSPKGYAGTDEAPIPPELEALLPDSGEVLRPDFAVRAEPVRSVPAPSPVPASGASASPESGPPLPGVRESAAAYQASAPDKPDAPGTPGTPGGWQLLVQVCGPGEDFDRAARVGGRRGSGSLEISPHGRMERLLRHTGVPAGLLFNGLSLRLVSAPRGESSGWLDFRVPDMCQSAGRPISTAMRLLLRETRLLAAPRPQRLAGLLADSRKFQNEVSERLAEQVLHALYELLRGFQAAHDVSKGALLADPLAANPDNIYRGLLTLVLRLVFLLYAEERDMLPQDDTFLGAYSLAGLHERLREDAALHPDTMDQRYGAYAQLLVLFRMVHDGARAGGMALPPRHGALFDPDRYRFLEGRTEGGARQIHERIEPPLVPDGTIHRVLQKLIVLDGERISYRALDVEHIGSVYETMMGFRLETAAGRSAAIRAAKKHGAPAPVDVEALLREAPARRAKWIQDRTDRKLTDRVKQAVRESGSVEALHAALDPVIDRHATPDLVPAGAMVLQPSEERRRSGSHYTPRELTGPIVRTTLEPVEPMEPEPPPGPVGEKSAEPIVRTTLRPVLGRLRGGRSKPPRPERILDLKVCDPAMGSGAFGLIATNTIAQGDTRSTGLRWICEHGGEIYRARRRVKWPGLAAVVVSVLHVAKGRFPGGVQHLGDKAAPDHGFGTLSAGSFPGVKRLDGEAAETITAFLFHRGGHDDPARLAANAGKSFVGSYVLGMGFTFDDTDTKGVATPLAEMRRLIEANPRNRQAIFPYIGGEEVNTSPTHAHHRYVINFRDWPLRREEAAWEAREGIGESREGVGESRAEDGAEWCRYPLNREDVGESWADADDERRRELRRQPIVPHDYPEPVAADWPELLAIVEERVKPERMKLNRKVRRERWWQFGDRQPALQGAVVGLERVLVTGAAAVMYHMITFISSHQVFSHKLIVFPSNSTASFAALQSRIHEIWSAFFGTTFGSADALTYNPTKVFYSFPFPENWEAHPALEAVGKAYYEHRATLMVRNDEGMTKTYNRFHDPYENDSDIAELRALHAAMDRAVLDAYGWSDIPTDCEFQLDYAIDEATWGRKRKPYRYRWPDATRDEVLARLLELNAERAAEETRAGAAARAKPKFPGISGSESRITY